MIRSNGRVSLYVQIKQKIRARVEKNEWQSGAKIPGEHELAALFSVSRATIRKALDELEHEGIVSRRIGDGTYVAAPRINQRLGSFYSFSEEVRALGMSAETVMLEFAVLPADAASAARLQIDESAAMYRIRRLRLADGIPFALETSLVPQALFPHLTRESVQSFGLYETMRKSGGPHPDGAQETFEAILMSPEEAALLQSVLPAAALYMERITTADGTIVESCVSIVRSDRYKYHVLLRQAY